MNRNSLTLALAGVLALTGLAAHAETPDPSGQYVISAASTRTTAQVQAELAQYKQSGINPWSTSYNPLKSFRSTKAQQQVQQEYLASRDVVKAMNGEDSGSAYLAAHRGQTAGTSLASR